jgi:hypothetical protein
MAYISFSLKTAIILDTSLKVLGRCPRDPKTGLYQFPTAPSTVSINLASHASLLDPYSLWH